nr:unnamed protein product [Callosobruchus chinensis]
MQKAFKRASVNCSSLPPLDCSGQELIKIGYCHNVGTCFSQMSPGLD